MPSPSLFTCRSEARKTRLSRRLPRTDSSIVLRSGGEDITRSSEAQAPRPAAATVRSVAARLSQTLRRRCAEPRARLDQNGWPGLCRSAGGHDAELLHERQHVRDTPVLADQARAVEPHDVDELHVHAACRSAARP